MTHYIGYFRFEVQIRQVIASILSLELLSLSVRTGSWGQLSV